MSRRLESLQIETQYVNPAMLSDRLDPLRQQQLADVLEAGQPRLNRDLYPISYFYSSVLWSSQFRGLESRLFSTLAGLDHSWFLDVPLVLFLLVLLVLGARGSRPVFLLTPLAVTGWTTIVCEVIAILWVDPSCALTSSCIHSVISYRFSRTHSIASPGWLVSLARRT